jgi:DNA-binding MurR/RpiR family transcriptional regulator
MASSPPTIAERIRRALPTLPRAERRVALLILSTDLLTGLESVARLATRAQTSAPTVLRLLDRLGFDGYPAFQDEIKAELAARLASPAQLYPTGPARRDLAARMFDGLSRAVGALHSQLPADQIDVAVQLLADTHRPVWTVGGRFSSMLADYLAAHLQLLRPAVHTVPASPAARTATLLDIDRRGVVVAFDYRRYQSDTVAFGAAAKRQRAAVVLLTDQYLSPLAAHADLVLATSVEACSPFDVLTPAVAVVETLVACLVNQLGDPPRERMTRYDTLTASVGDEPA